MHNISSTPISLPLSLRQLEYALAVQKTGNFSLAAKACFVSQPSLSESIQKLEQELGIQLFDRTRTPIQVTEVGAAVLSHAEMALGHCAQLFEIADSWNKQVRGTLRLGLIPTIAPGLIPLFLKSFRKKHPLVKVEILELGTDRLLEHLDQGKVDAAILSTPASAPGYLTEKPLFYEGFLVYAAKENDLLKEDLIKFPDLEDQNLILMDETHCVRDQILSICERKKDHSSKTTVHGGIQTLLSVVDQENGFTLIPELLAEVVNKKQLRSIKTSPFRRKISLLTNKTHVKKRLVELLAEEILLNLPETIPTKLTQKIQVVDPNKGMF